MTRTVLLAAMPLLLWGCSTRDCCCPTPRRCPSVPCPPDAPPPVADKPDPLRDEKLKAAMAGLDQWFYDEVYTANRDLQACLLQAGKEQDPAAAKKSEEECIARFNARLDAAEKNLVQTRKAVNDAIGSPSAAPSQPPKR